MKKNINIARLSDLETIEAFGGKTFRRLNNFDLKLYKFDTILVDPPRSGLSPESIDSSGSFLRRCLRHSVITFEC